MRTPEQVAAEFNFGKPSAAKRGNRSEWPYVPVVDYGRQKTGPFQRTKQIMGRAFATREEAVAYSEKCIAAWREDLARRLREPRMRALRLHHGLPQEAADLPKQ